MKTKNFVLSAFILSIASLFAKFLGAVYRIPLTNLLGGEGIGLYQLVFPLYSLLLVLTSLGIPNAIAKIISQKIAKNEEHKIPQVLNISIVFFSVVCLIIALIVFYGANFFSILQGNEHTAELYKIIAPSIYFVGILSIFRGYFQGYQNMTPTGLSLIVEQVCKLAFGLTFAYILLPHGLIDGAKGAVFGVTISEIIAFCIIALQFLFHKRKQLANPHYFAYQVGQDILKQSLTTTPNFRQRFHGAFIQLKELIKTTIPITISSSIMPIVIFIDSLLIVNLLVNAGFSVSTSTNMYGILTGVVNSLINLPSVIALAVATCLLPNISSHYAQKNFDSIMSMSKNAIKIVLYISMPIFVVFLIAPSEIISILYSGLNDDNINQSLLASNLLKLASISVVFITLIQITTTILQSIDKSSTPIYSLLIGCSVKILLTIILVSISSVNIFGALCGSVVCYLIACVLNLKALIKSFDIKFELSKEIILPVLAMVIMAIILFASLKLLSFLTPILNLAMSGAISMLVYVAILLKSKSIALSKKNS